MSKRIQLLTVLFFFLCATSGNSQATSIPVFPVDAWGVYSWTGLKGLNKDNAPHIKGGPIIISWSSLEPQNGKFEFEKEIGDKLKMIDDNNFYTFLKVWVAPATNNVTATDTSWGLTPKWLFKNGVPLVEFPKTINPLGATTTRYFPYYLDEHYKFYFHRMIDAVGKYVLSLPPHLRKRILYIQSAEGSTGMVDLTKANLSTVLTLFQSNNGRIFALKLGLSTSRLSRKRGCFNFPF
jgi:hypothetical protein